MIIVLPNDENLKEENLDEEPPIPWYIVQIVLTVLPWITIVALMMGYTIRMHIFPAMLGSFIFGVIFLAVPGLWKWELWKRVTCLAVNMLLNVWSWYLIFMFGLGNLSRIKYTGNYKIGHKTIYTK